MKFKIKEKNFSLELFIPSLFLSLFILLFLSNLTNLFPNSFHDRTMGNALMLGMDISQRINNMYIFLFLLAPLFTSILDFLLNKISFPIRIKKELNILSVLGIINLIMYFICQLKETKIIIYPSLFLLFEMIVILILINLFTLKFNKLNIENINWVFIAIIPFMFFGSLFLDWCGLNLNGNIVSVIIFGIGSICLFILSHLKFIKFEALKKSYTLFLISPIIECIYLGLYNILNQYNIIISHKILNIFLIYFLCFILFALYYLKIRNKKITFDYKKIYYPIVILIFSLIIAQLPLINLVQTDFFESANHGNGIFEFFRYGKIPFLESFDAHMLRYQLWGILYGLLNHDINGAIFALYSSYEIVVIYLVIYIFLNYFFNKDFSLLILLFLPLGNDIGLMNYALGLIAILTLTRAFKIKTYFSFGAYWFSCILLCLWNLDVGYSSLLSSICLGLYIYMKNKDQIKISRIIIPLVIILAFFVVFYLTICLLKNINPFFRTFEFLKLAMSNVNWAYETLGNKTQFSYIIAYYIIPLIMIFSIIYVFYKYQKKSMVQNIFLLFLGLFFLFNFQRGIVRHSLAENSLKWILSFFFLFLSLLFYQHLIKEKKEIKFIAIYISFIFLGQLLLSTEIPNYTNTIHNGFTKYNSFKIQYEFANEKVERVQISSKMKDNYIKLKETINNLLSENETFLDLSNQTLLYALLDREKPVYINQSPALLSGEFSQQLFLKEFKEFYKDVPIIIKSKNKQNSVSLDGLSNDYRYYLVSEEIFKNFEPIVYVNDFIIWVKKEKTQEYINKLSNKKNVVLIDKKEYVENDLKEIDLYYIPYIWGTYDKSKKEIMKQPILKENKYIFEISSEEKAEGNYIEFEIKSNSENSAEMKICANEDCTSTFKFNIKQGSQKYLIRVSTIYDWYQTNINNLVINFGENSDINVESVSILKGDTLKEIDK